MSGSGLRVSPYDLIGGIMRYQRMEGSCPERKTMHLPYNIAFFWGGSYSESQTSAHYPRLSGIACIFHQFLRKLILF